MSTHTILAITLLAVAANAGRSVESVDDLTERELIDAVRSENTSDQDKAAAFQQLAIVGGKTAVPELAEQLKDPRFSYYARYALQNNPSKQAAAALRAALDEVDGPTLLGVIHSVAARRDALAAPQLTELALAGDASISLAAVSALVDVDPKTARSVLANADAAIRTRMADALLACGERLATQGERAAALGLLAGLDAEGTPRAVRVAAILAVLRYSEASDATSLTKNLLSSPEDWRFKAGLQACVQRCAPESVSLILGIIDPEMPLRHLLILKAIEALGDRRGADAARDAVTSDFAEVRIQGVLALRTLGEASDVGLLFKLARQESELGEAALSSLTRINDEGLDAAIVEMVRRTAGPQRLLAVKLVGERRILSGADTLVEVAAADDSATTRLAALRAARRLAVGESLPGLLSLAVGGARGEERRLGREAALAAASRVSDRNAAADMVTNRFGVAAGDNAGFLLDVLSAIGGPRALEAVAAAARRGQSDLEDQATRVLGNWPTPDAAEVLLELARSDSPYATRALRGYLRIARQLAGSSTERVSMCREALNTAERDAERLLVLQILERDASVEALGLAIGQLSNDRLVEQAGETVLRIANRVSRKNPQAAAAAARQLINAGVSEPVARGAGQLLSE